MPPELIFDGTHLRCVLHPGKTTQLMVTLDWRRDGKNEFSPDQYSTSFARMGFAQLSIKTRMNDWFLNPDTLDAEQALRRIAAMFDRVHMLGFSMGGYGALRFAAAMGARSVVVVSPQWSLNTDQASFDTRYQVESTRFDHDLGDLTPCAMPHLGGLVLVDPFDRADMAHARKITALFPKLQIVRLNFGGHPAFQIVREQGKSWTLQHAAVARSAKPALIIAAHRAGRRGSAGYWQRLAMAAQALRPDLSAYALAQARAIGVDAARESP